ncbi:MAG TPA: hypothetical protein VF906_05455 [Candidatus Bathyarchaeia archaeon]
MRDSLRETPREARQIRRTAIEEEILIRVANIDKTCNNALRHVRKAESLLRKASATTKATRREPKAPNPLGCPL